MSKTLLSQLYVFPSVTPVCFASHFLVCSLLLPLLCLSIPLCLTAYFHDFYAESQFNPSVLASCFAPWYCLFFLCLSIPLLASKYVHNTSLPIICLWIRYSRLLCFPLSGLLSVVAFTLPANSSLSNRICPWFLCRILFQSVRSHFLLCSLILPFLSLPKYTSPCISICPTLLCQLHVFSSVTPVCFPSRFLVCSLLLRRPSLSSLAADKTYITCTKVDVKYSYQISLIQIYDL